MFPLDLIDQHISFCIRADSIVIFDQVFVENLTGRENQNVIIVGF